MARNGTGTRERLLDAACELIARKGYRATTHQEICDRAEANVAAINYYFGSKERLYEAVLLRAREMALEAHDSMSAAEGLSAEDRLRHYVQNRVECVLDDGPGGWLPQIIFWAIGEHVESLEQVLEEYVRPQLTFLHDLMVEMLGPYAEEFNVNWCAFSIHSQCVHLNVTRMRRRGPFAQGQLPPEKHASLIWQLQEFVLGGIERVREQIEQGKQAESDESAKPDFLGSPALGPMK
jgi:AcrR family transcriptional regulator